MRKTVIHFGLLAAFVIGVASIHSYVLGFDPRETTQFAGAGLLIIGIIGSALGALFMPANELSARRLLFHAAVLAVIGGCVLALSQSEKEVAAALVIAPFLSALALTWLMDRICPSADGPARYEGRVPVLIAVLFGFLSALARMPYDDFWGVAPLFVFGFACAFALTRKPSVRQAPPRPASLRPERTQAKSNVWVK